MGGEFWPLEIRAVNVEGVLFSSGLLEEDLSWGVLILFGIDVTGDVGVDSNLLGDVSLDEGIGVRDLGRIVI